MYALISYGLQPLQPKLTGNQLFIKKKKNLAAITGVIIRVILYLQEL